MEVNENRRVIKGERSKQKTARSTLNTVYILIALLNRVEHGASHNGVLRSEGARAPCEEEQALQDHVAEKGVWIVRNQ